MSYGPPPSTPAHVIAVVSPKGGVGKTTLCSALACSLARHGRVIAVDLDPQNACNITSVSMPTRSCRGWPG
ncbi:ParA family protein, partial [Herbaspirillum sp. B65]|uniref:ParA family protein n=1 Tax=Herbaspirillum sp. B65 TaxID=137708 RepID=UPI003F8CBE22